MYRIYVAQFTMQRIQQQPLLEVSARILQAIETTGVRRPAGAVNGKNKVNHTRVHFRYIIPDVRNDTDLKYDDHYEYHDQKYHSHHF